MHWKNGRSRLAGIVLVLLSFGVAGAANAVGTPSATSINNQASVAYSVGASAQAPELSNIATFVVDQMVDLTVTEVGSSYSTVATGGVTEVLIYSVNNTGNATMDFLLTATDQVGGADPFGGTDNFNAPLGATSGIFEDTNDNGVYDAGVDLRAFVDQLGQDLSQVVFIVRDIGAQANGDVSAIALTAQAADSLTPNLPGTALVQDNGVDVPGAVQVVFADGTGDVDGPRDGQYSDTDAFLVGAALITVTKSSVVFSDPFNGTTNPKAIPGAIVEYTVTISNGAGASASATNVTVTDDLTNEIVTNGTVAFTTDSYGAGQGIQVTPPGGAATPLSNAVDVDAGDFTANAVTVSGITLAPGESATVNFRVTIQ